jgi:hypothetical protein
MSTARRSRPVVPLATVTSIVKLRAHEGSIADARALIAAAVAPGVTAYTRRDSAHRAATFSMNAIASISTIGQDSRGPLRARVRALVLEADGIWKQAQTLLDDRPGRGASVAALVILVRVPPRFGCAAANDA